jgi:hypothetical protein
MALGFALTAFWPWNIAGIFPDKRQNANRTDAAPQFHPALKGAAEVSNGGSSNGVPYNRVNVGLSAADIQPPWFVTQEGFHAEAILKSGRKLQAAHSAENTMERMEQFQMLSDAMMQKMAGFKPWMNEPSRWNTSSVQIFNYEAAQHPGEDLAGATIKGEVTLRINKFVVVKTMPFASGEMLRLPRKNYILHDVAFGPGGVRCKVVSNSVYSTLRGDTSDIDWWGIKWLVYNRAKNEYLRGGGGSSGTYALFYTVITSEQNVLQPVPNEQGKAQQAMAADWENGAEISFFTVEPGAMITLPFEMKNVDLGH